MADTDETIDFLSLFDEVADDTVTQLMQQFPPTVSTCNFVSDAKAVTDMLSICDSTSTDNLDTSQTDDNQEHVRHEHSLNDSVSLNTSTDSAFSCATSTSDTSASNESCNPTFPQFHYILPACQIMTEKAVDESDTPMPLDYSMPKLKPSKGKKNLLDIINCNL